MFAICYNSITNSYVQDEDLCPNFMSKMKLLNLSKEYGFSKVLEPLIKDLQKLETEGIDVTLEIRSYKLYGSISIVIADNLAAHCLGGFFENFSTVERVCRHCNCHKMRSSINLMRIILLFAQKRFMINKLKQFLKIQNSVSFMD